MSHMDRNNSKPNQYRISGSNKSSMNYSIDSYRTSGAMNSSFGLSGSACFAAQKEAVLLAERERIRLIREEQARNAERQAALERTYADRQRSDIVDRIRKKQAQDNAAKRKAVQEHYWKTKSLGSVGLGKRNLDGASTTDSEDDEELRRVLMASMHSPGLRPHHSTSEDDVGSDYSSTASGIDYQDTRKVFRGSNGYNADQYEYDDDEEEYDEEGGEEDDLNSEEEMEMRKSLMYSMQAASPRHHTPTFIHRLMSDVYDPNDAIRGDTIVLSQDDDEEELKSRLVSVKIVLNDADVKNSSQQKSQQLQPNQQQEEEEKVSPLRSRSTIQKSDVTYDLTGPSSSADNSSSSSMSLQEQRMAAAASVKPEPSDKGPASGFSQVLIRMPNGTKFPRRFRWSDTIKDLKNFIESKADESGLGYEYEITRDFPKKTFHDLPLHTRLDSAGLTSRTLLQIKEI